jgi:CopG antitoxin of type II toxin-antitoxin system
MSKLKKIPKFSTEEEERIFWQERRHDSTEYLDWPKAKLAKFPNLKASTSSSLA